MKKISIKWTQCHTYDDAKNFYGAIYLHEWNNEPFYWGKAHNSFFGGSRRSVNGKTMSGRYNPGYRHWIEGCLMHGAKLYLGLVNTSDIDLVENHLINLYGSKMNRRIKDQKMHLKIDHTGTYPNWF